VQNFDSYQDSYQDSPHSSPLPDDAFHPEENMDYLEEGEELQTIEEIDEEIKKTGVLIYER
jgi:hypothetical protein